MKNILGIILLVTFVISCNEKSTNPESNVFKVAGKLIYNNKPLETATVSLNESLNYTVQSDVNGSFQINNVPKGNYNLKIQKTFANGSFLSKSSLLEVNNNIYLDALRLPKGVLLHEAENVSDTKATISWSPTDANDFREYKLFRHSSSGIDENTGTLVHVSTSIIDTVYTENKLVSLTEYYYRIYIMNEYGKLGGSNIIKLTTQNKNLIQNGDFEEVGSDSLPIGWEFRNDVFKTIVSNQAHSGNKYLFGNATKYVYDLSWGSLQHRVPYTNIIPGSQYTLSFWYYIEELAGKSELFIEFNPEQSMFIWDSITDQQKGVWKKYERTFTAPSNISSDFFLRFEVRVHIPYNNELWKVRIDDVSLLKKE